MFYLQVPENTLFANTAQKTIKKLILFSVAKKEGRDKDNSFHERTSSREEKCALFARSLCGREEIEKYVDCVSSSSSSSFSCF